MIKGICFENLDLQNTNKHLIGETLPLFLLGCTKVRRGSSKLENRNRFKGSCKIWKWMHKSDGSDFSYVKSSVYNKTEQALIKVSVLAAGLLPLLQPIWESIQSCKGKDESILIIFILPISWLEFALISPKARYGKHLITKQGHRMMLLIMVSIFT